MHKRVWITLSILLLCASCQKFAEGRQMFHDILQLRDGLAKEFHEQVVDVSLNGRESLTVKFVNSPIDSASREEKQKRADAVAAFVMKNYPHHLSTVSTQFVAKRGPVGVGETFVGHPMP